MNNTTGTTKLHNETSVALSGRRERNKKNMRYGKFIKLLSTLIVGTMAVSLASSANSGAEEAFEISSTSEKKAAEVDLDLVEDLEGDSYGNEVQSVVSRELPVYYCSSDVCYDGNFYFVNDCMDIPYVDVDTVVEFLNDSIALLGIEDEEIGFTYDNEEGTAMIYSWDMYCSVIDYNENTIYFPDYNAFFRMNENDSLIDVSSGGMIYDESGSPLYLMQTDLSFERYGSDITIDLNEYNIRLYHTDEGDLMPLQTFVDIFELPLSIQMLFNGEAVFFTVNSLEETDLYDMFYDTDVTTRSKALIAYNYYELCLVLDMNYGLKEAHNIEYFDKLFRETGLYYDLISDNPTKAAEAIYQLTNGYLGDLHSTLYTASAYAGEMTEYDTSNISITEIMDSETGDRYMSARSSQYPDGVPFYEEVGNTAYLTLDGFTYDIYADYYTEGLPEDTTLWDTRAEVIYAHSQITRADSPIENVVLDLSLNGGGTVTTAAYFIGWASGGCSLNFEDTFTGAQVTANYVSDVDLDGDYDEDDTLNGYNVYCLITPYSFSCGNLAPVTFKATGTVTLLGSRSGGGACVVTNLNTADGTYFRISGRTRISSVINGSFYDVDQGVDADYHINKVENYYNRNALTEYINSLY